MDNNETTTDSWGFPGSCWWRFDFHSHTPASTETTAWQQAVGTTHEVTPEKWLLKYMAAGIDCVAVTDHNCGDWIDGLKAAYEAMSSNKPEGFREIHVFPGVEISVQGGIHLLALFDPSDSARKISDLLAVAEYRGTPCNSNDETRLGAADVIRKIIERDGIAIPAHADGPRGLLETKEGTQSPVLSAHMIRQVLQEEGILAMERLDPARQLPAIYEEHNPGWTRVVGSDCHNFRGGNVPGSRYTWVKMAEPNIEGLRLALLDGNDFSIRCSDEGDFDPFSLPDHFIESVEIEEARFMGRGNPSVLAFTPYYNALIGGRGTGKSSVVHALRMAYRREQELYRFGAESTPRTVFESFRKVGRSRADEGGLTESTAIRLTLNREGVRHRLTWRQDGQGTAVENWRDDRWEASQSQTISADRFPLRLLSQGQIAAMAGEDRQAVLDIIDDAAGAESAKHALEEARRGYLTLTARLRELDGRLAGRDETQRKLDDIKRKLEGFAKAQHAGILKTYQLASRQRREVKLLLEQAGGFRKRLRELATELTLDDWPEGSFDSAADADVLAWRDLVEQAVIQAREQLEQTAKRLEEGLLLTRQDERFFSWQQRMDKAASHYDQLKASLAAEGVQDPQAFGQLVQERQRLESTLGQFDQWQQDRKDLSRQIEAQLQRVVDTRRYITTLRRSFFQEHLKHNPFVRIEVVEFGHDEKELERSLRDTLDVGEERFRSDFLGEGTLGEKVGLVARLLRHPDRMAGIDGIKTELLTKAGILGGHLRNFLERKLRDQPEFADRIRFWFPDDDLTIEYCRKGDGRDFTPIAQGSAGQRAAAMLAFLLAFGDEPLVLDQPEDDLDNHLIYDLIVQQIRSNKRRRQLIVVTHNPNIAVNGDAEMVHALDFNGQCFVREKGALQERVVRDEVRRVMEGGQEALARRWARLGREL